MKVCVVFLFSLNMFCKFVVGLERKSQISQCKRAISGDLYQRQPLLPNPKNNDYDPRNSEYYVDEEEDVMDKGSIRNGDIKIDIPASREEPRFPQERWKTLLGKTQTNFVSSFWWCRFSFCDYVLQFHFDVNVAQFGAR